ncbi:MAG: sugar ABC transporter substrate-binding protein [Sphaerochaeta sp.]|nr:sugar ABC transporter substrate-binding protein [Sphaerochaeta sp.]
MKKRVLSIVLMMIVSLALFAQGASEPAAAKKVLAPRPAFDSEVLAPSDEGLVTPVKNVSGKKYKIAIIGLENNPFWVDVKAGAMDAIKELAAVGVTAEWLLPPGDSHNSNVFGTAIESCVIQEYDAIATIAGDSGVVPFINKAVEAGIPVATFNSETGTVNKRLFFVGADLYQQGVSAAKYMNQELNGKGNVCIITGFFSVEAHELRRKGFLDEIAKIAPGIKILDQVENTDKGDIAYSQTNDFMSAHPNLNAVLVCAGGAFGAGKAIEDAGKAGKIKLINYDFVSETMAQIVSGACSGTIGQNPYAQGHDPAIRLYNYLEADVVPVAGRLLTRSDYVTKANMAEFGF